MYNDCEAFFLREQINEYQNLRQGRYFHNIFSLVDSNCISEVIVMYHVFFYVFLLQKPNLYYDHCFYFSRLLSHIPTRSDFVSSISSPIWFKMV